ncbi:MAG: hypothetical protein ABW352_09060 [Polyangiales bacterium]
MALVLGIGCGDDADDSDAAAPIDASTPDALVAPLDARLPNDASDAAQDASVPFVCDVVAPTSCPDPAPKFADVQPIFVNQCGACHGQDWTGEWPLNSYSHIADWQDEIRADVTSCRMPPPESGVKIPLADRMKILHWIRCGLPR